MKTKFFFYQFFMYLRFIFILLAGSLNAIGIYFILESKPHWEIYIHSSIVALGLVLISSMSMGNIQRSIASKGLSLFLANQNMENATVIRQNEKAALIQFEEKFFTVETKISFKDICFLLVPASAEWETFFLDKKGGLSRSTLSFMPSWESPNWNESRKNATPIPQKESVVEAKEVLSEPTEGQSDPSDEQTVTETEQKEHPSE